MISMNRQLNNSSSSFSLQYATADVEMMILGNKCDCACRVVSTKRGQLVRVSVCVCDNMISRHMDMYLCVPAHLSPLCLHIHVTDDGVCMC